jgi:hypothetical protein
LDRVVEKHKNTPNRSTNCEDRRGGTVGAAPGCPFKSVNTISFNNMMKME